MSRKTNSHTVFLDRDGVINVGSSGYVRTWDEFVFEQGALDALCLLHRGGLRLIVVTNQSGINRGLYSQKDVDDIHCRMMESIRRHGGDLDGIYVCPHRPDENCECRKPRSGLLLQAAREHGIELHNSFMVGDKPRDIASGKAVGCRTIFIEEGTDTEFEFNDTNRPDLSCPRLSDAAEIILEEIRRNSSVLNL